MTQTAEKESLASAPQNLSLADDRRVVAFYEGFPPFRGNAALNLGFRDGMTGGHREAVANMNRELTGRGEREEASDGNTKRGDRE